MANEFCAGCGYTLAPEDQACPRCKLAVTREQPPAEDRRPRVTQAEGQDPPGTWGYFVFIARRDPLLAGVFVLLALNVVVNVALVNPLGTLLSAAIFWGVYTFQAWGFWVAVAGSALGVLLGIMAFTMSPAAGSLLIAVPFYNLFVLWLRKDYFG